MGNCIDTTARVDHSMNNAACEFPASLSRVISLYICPILPFITWTAMSYSMNFLDWHACSGSVTYFGLEFLFLAVSYHLPFYFCSSLLLMSDKTEIGFKGNSRNFCA
jgi:hypothetical protein